MADSIPVSVTESKDPGFDAALAYMKEQRAAAEGKPEPAEEKPAEETPTEPAKEPETPADEEEKTEEKAEEPGEKPSKQLLALVKQEKKLRAWKQELKESTEKLRIEIESHRQKMASVEAKEKELEAFREALHRDPVGTIDEVLKRTSKIGLDELIKTREDPLQRELLETRRELAEIKNTLNREREKQPEDRKPAAVTSEDAEAWANYQKHVAQSIDDPKWQYVKRFAEKHPARFDRMVFNEVVQYWHDEGQRTGQGLAPTEALERIESMISDLYAQQDNKKIAPLKTLSQASVSSNPNKERDDDAERFEAARKELRRLMGG
jgi:small-conductance mechanosensitive channel